MHENTVKEGIGAAEGQSIQTQKKIRRQNKIENNTVEERYLRQKMKNELNLNKKEDREVEVRNTG